ncbi:hypothetical protein [Stenotrophomonas phage CM2]
MCFYLNVAREAMGAFIFTLLFNTTVDINYQFWIYDDWPETGC